jgi:hypothetical protein
MVSYELNGYFDSRKTFIVLYKFVVTGFSKALGVRMSKKGNPYIGLGSEAFWRSAVADVNPLQIMNLWKPKFQFLPDYKIATAGSCFAQHIGRALMKRGYHWFDSEPAPSMMNERQKNKFNYGVFSFRTGNIYTPVLLKQWIEWALGVKSIPEEVWQREDGRFFDPFRPNIEPEGFVSREELFASRDMLLRAIKRTFETVDVFIFTLGLTEAWVNAKTGYVYPMCPGTIAGDFNEAEHHFKNYSYPETRTALREAFNLIKTINPDIKFLLTVSPVPLTATASGDHVLTATLYSKSVLRAVAGDMAEARLDTDYFPSYEIISAFPFKSMFYMPNMRSVAPEGVEFVMNSFFEGQQKAFGEGASRPTQKSASRKNTSDGANEHNEEVCEDVLLEAFA